MPGDGMVVRDDDAYSGIRSLIPTPTSRRFPRYLSARHARPSTALRNLLPSASSRRRPEDARPRRASPSLRRIRPRALFAGLSGIPARGVMPARRDHGRGAMPSRARHCRRPEPASRRARDARHAARSHAPENFEIAKRHDRRAAHPRRQEYRLTAQARKRPDAGPCISNAMHQASVGLTVSKCRNYPTLLTSDEDRFKLRFNKTSLIKLREMATRDIRFPPSGSGFFLFLGLRPMP